MRVPPSPRDIPFDLDGHKVRIEDLEIIEEFYKAVTNANIDISLNIALANATEHLKKRMNMYLIISAMAMANCNDTNNLFAQWGIE